MGGLFENVKNYLYCFILGAVLGAVCMFISFCGDSRRSTDPAAITTTTVSGDAQTVSDVHTTNGSLLLTTAATGPGVATTAIPISLIPEANNWLTKRHTIIGKLYYLWTPEGFYPGFGLDYQYRIDRLVFVGGIVFAQKYAGINAGAGVVF